MRTVADDLTEIEAEYQPVQEFDREFIEWLTDKILLFAEDLVRHPLHPYDTARTADHRERPRQRRRGGHRVRPPER